MSVKFVLVLSFAWFSGSAAVAETSASIDAPACIKPSLPTTLGVDTTRTEDFDTAGAYVYGEYVVNLRPNIHTPSGTKDATCAGDQLFLTVPFSTAIGDSDFSESRSFRIGAGLRYYKQDWRTTFGIIGTLGNDYFEVTDDSIEARFIEGSVAQRYSICLEKDDEGTCKAPNRLIGSAFVRAGWSDQRSRRPNRFGNITESNYATTGVGFALNYAMGNADIDPYLRDAKILRAEFSMDDKIDSGPFDINKVYTGTLYYGATKDYRTVWRVGLSSKWGSDDFQGIALIFTRDWF